MSSIESLTQQFKDTLDAEQQTLHTMLADVAIKREHVSSLEKAYAALTGKHEPKTRQLRARTPGPNGTSLKSKLVEILQASPTAMDLGSLTRAVLGTDDSRSRTRISAALSPIAADPAGVIRRIGVGSYVSRAASGE